MGHNIPNRVRRANLLVTRLGCLGGVGWVFVLTCSKCGRTHERPLDPLIGRFGAARLDSVVRRFRCSACTRSMPIRPSVVLLSNRLHTVILLGPGAFE